MNRFVATRNPTFSQAVCKQYDNNIWFDSHTTKQAVELCQTCPEIEACRQYALTLPIDTEGVFAGLTAKQLKPLRKANGNPPVIDHGTARGYVKHLRYGIEPCQACREANVTAYADQRRDYKRRQRAKKTVPGNFEHGTNSGYTKHYLYGIPVCDDCKKAKAAYMRQRYNSKK